jgi:hypothetical protein
LRAPLPPSRTAPTWLPSLPAVVWSHNEDDLRLLNLGEAHLLMPWQDQLSNIFSQLLMKMKHSLLRVILINTDVVPKAIVDKLAADLNSPKYYVAPHLLEVSFKEVGEGLGLDLDKVFRVSAASSTARVDRWPSACGAGPLLDHEQLQERAICVHLSYYNSDVQKKYF